ncbi:hypothetical protein FBY40_0407 [Microbacterium sp. SLBN-154]|uniref:hypothetical protein n=1 Tax=Microbacterium sp. SLBN-154 TaxID=2768458 RepID=UPI00114EFF82|nr:hypothetical protein [Microbacterium sp. SLBN-154]TQK17925.1 hypothetical protein FBY40_0407 [Microbacterium sp. SLBN-154]
MDARARMWGSHLLATVRDTEFAVSLRSRLMWDREPVLLLPSAEHIADLPWVAELLDENRRITVEHASMTRLRRVDAYGWYAGEGPFSVTFFGPDRDRIREPRPRDSGEADLAYGGPPESDARVAALPGLTNNPWLGRVVGRVPTAEITDYQQTFVELDVTQWPIPIVKAKVPGRN